MPIVVRQIPLEVLHAHLVEVLVLAEVVSLLLDGVIRQVDEAVAQVVEAEFAATSPNIAILVEVALDSFVDAREKCEDSEVELATMNEQRLVNVALDDDRRAFHLALGRLVLWLLLLFIFCHGRVDRDRSDGCVASSAVVRHLLDQSLNLRKLVAHSDAIASVRVGAWLHDPYVTRRLILLLQRLHLSIVRCPALSVRELLATSSALAVLDGRGDRLMAAL